MAFFGLTRIVHTMDTFTSTSILRSLDVVLQGSNLLVGPLVRFSPDYFRVVRILEGASGEFIVDLEVRTFFDQVFCLMLTWYFVLVFTDKARQSLCTKCE